MSKPGRGGLDLLLDLTQVGCNEYYALRHPLMGGDPAEHELNTDMMTLRRGP